MSEKIAVYVFCILCAGQVVALIKGRLTAVRYFTVVAPLGYFSYWKFLTWNPARVCGLLVIVGGIFLWRHAKGTPRFTQHRMFLFLFYLTIVTLIGSLFWPTKALSGARSSAYNDGLVRAGVGIFNWFIVVGAAWQIAKALSQPGAFEKVRNTIVIVGMLHCAYAVYQVTAYYHGLPMTGIRRPYSGVGADFGGEQFATDHFGGELLYRVNSLVGEPKTFGAISLIWITAMFTLNMEGKGGSRWVLVLAFIVLGLTYSTTAWAGGVMAVALALWVWRHYGTTWLSRLVIPILAVVWGLLILDSLGVLPLDHQDVTAIIWERSAQPWAQVASSGVQGVEDIETRRMFFERPALFICGIGVGGIPFYLAKILGGNETHIMAPGTGYWGFICDMGVVGIILLFFCLLPGLRPTLLRLRECDPAVRSLSYMGCVLLYQCFVFTGGLLPFALGFLLAAEFRDHTATLSESGFL